MLETSSRPPRQPGRRITRRALLSGAAADVLLFGVPWRSAQARGLDLATFLQLSEKLTAHPHLPPGVAKHYLRSIVGLIGPPGQEAKAAAGDGHPSLNSRIVADWYSGQTIASGGMVSIDYVGALLWEAIGFAKPRGIPDAEAGRWALAPF